METAMKNIVEWNKEALNQAIKSFPQVYPMTEDMNKTFSGISRMVMLDRYSFKDTMKETLAPGDLVVLTVRPDPQYPGRGIGIVQAIENKTATIWVEEAYRGSLMGEEQETGLVKRPLDEIDKPLEIYYEQIAKRNAHGLAAIDKNEDRRQEIEAAFYQEESQGNFVPAGRVLYGAGSGTDVTYFNCYVMPYVPDSRGGIADHRKEVMEIMSRGGGVGTNGSTLRPRHSLVRGVNGKSSGAVSWLDDIAKLTHLVEQGGSRRGAQMIMLADWHPDILEFIISKMQNPRILQFIKESSKDSYIKQLVDEKLKFVYSTPAQIDMFQAVVDLKEKQGGDVSDAAYAEAKENLELGGHYEVNEPDFLTGANISVAISSDFMEAVKEGKDWTLRFPAVEKYDQEEMAAYDTQWQEIGDVREWEAMGHEITTYRTLPAQELWQLINICATYAAEPGIFFIDRANEDTNAVAYGQKVVATNPCGEQPLAPYSVCNLGAINLAQMADKENKRLNKEKLQKTVATAIRMQDNVIDATPYFLEANKKQALGERRIGLGVMGLADLLIYCEKRYGSKEGNQLVDEVFETIAVTAYQTSIELAKERGSFPFLIGETDEETQALRERFVQSGFMQRMPESIRQDVLKYGIRNSHLLTVAPTGSTGTMMNVSTGLEPYFAFKYYRTGRLGKFIEVNADIVQEYLDQHPEADADNLPDFFVSAMDLSPREHVDVQTTIQRWVDSSISKTVNAPKGYAVNQVAEVYEKLYEGGAKGGTVYVDGSRDSQVLTLNKDEHEDSDQDSQVDQNQQDDVVVVDDSEELRQLVDQAQAEANEDEVVFGSELGNTCPICRTGIVEEIGGCNTCSNCFAQLKCGL
ncbi:vitamin B12-dependent ribonucleotide reductase [Aerococcus urinae]